jgi:MSHA biogenesis protein MshO
MNSNRHNFARQTGFSLMEAVIVITISGIIVAAVALFIRAPVAGYVDTALRAELTDIADTALRRIGRDLRTALPNSIRVTSVGSVFYLEYLEVRTGGRYRAVTSGGATLPVCPNDDTRVTDNDILSFYASPSVSTDTCFKTLANIPNCAQIVNTDYLVVFNLGIPGVSAYESPNSNKSLISSTCTCSASPPANSCSTCSACTAGGNYDRIAFNAQTFTLPSPGSRFHVITGPVSYVCDPVAGTLSRYSGYAIQASQPNSTGAAPLSSAPVNALLASHVSACSFTYNAAVAAQRNGLVVMSLGVTEADSQGQNETVTLYESAHVSNVP